MKNNLGKIKALISEWDPVYYFVDVIELLIAEIESLRKELEQIKKVAVE